ncbi:MAG: ferrous iron transport protein B, partial [Muribaculaceae bacterium]|nr:ferrous iron transport protein B [Muribaculaceae bacterium]
NLYLTTQLIDMDRSMVIALNMYDELRKQGAQLDERMLGQMIGVPMVPIVAKTGEGIDALLDAVISVYEGRNSDVRHIHVNLGKEAEKKVDILKSMLKDADDTPRHFSPRYIAIKLLEQDPEIDALVSKMNNHHGITDTRDRLVRELETTTNDDVASHIANQKYGFISGALAETMTATPVDTNDSTRIIDAFVTNKLFGFPLFFIMMFIVFWATFSLGQYPMEWIESGVGALSAAVNKFMAGGPLKDLVVDGVIGGVGGVIVFLPNILILYFCISFMEDSGYMSRAAFIMDKVMHRIGLHGKSFIPLVMGFGCNVPAILASRSIESRSSRIITILINPFMSCSARLPVYVLLVGTFFPSNAATVFMGLYILGILVAIITARMLRKVYFKKDETPVVMELPPYRMPTLKALVRHMWGKTQQYLRKMGGIILFASIIVWALNYFPVNESRDSLHVSTSEMSSYDDSAIDPEND